MPKFRFQLEGVLRHRRTLERERQRQVAALQAQMNQMQEELRQINQSMQDAVADMRQNHLTGALNLSYMAAHRRYMLGMQRKALALMQRMALLQRQVDEARQSLIAAAKDRKAIEKLREKHHERWRETLARRELSEQDEIGMQLSYWFGGESTEEEEMPTLDA